jgi:hypothetical protein
MKGISAIGYKAHEALMRSGGKAEPVPSFDGAPYLLAANEVIWVGAKDIAMHPRAVVLPRASIRGETPRTFEIDRALPWRPSPMRISDRGSRSVAEGAVVLRKRTGEMGEARGLGVLTTGGQPEFPLDQGMPRIRAFLKALEKGDHNMVRETALPLLGFGPGLTPSGDDFVGAALFARQLVDDSREWLDVARALSEAITTRSNVISAALFRDLIQGQSFAPLHEMVSALVVHESVDRAMEAAKRLTGVGQSSGWDMFAGFVAGATGTL